MTWGRESRQLIRCRVITIVTEKKTDRLLADRWPTTDWPRSGLRICAIVYVIIPIISGQKLSSSVIRSGHNPSTDQAVSLYHHAAATVSRMLRQTSRSAAASVLHDPYLKYGFHSVVHGPRRARRTHSYVSHSYHVGLTWKRVVMVTAVLIESYRWADHAVRRRTGRISEAVFETSLGPAIVNISLVRRLSSCFHSKSLTHHPTSTHFPSCSRPSAPHPLCGPVHRPYRDLARKNTLYVCIVEEKSASRSETGTPRKCVG